ncbi:MAG: class I SAM-dependent methyltransferase [Patescibacteria group bacterium]
MAKQSVTRGSGILEGVLSQARTKHANGLISVEKRSGRILDIGCGSFPYFLTHTEFSEKYGIEQLEISQAENIIRDGITITNANLEKDFRLPFSSNYFDVVTMLAVFEHIEPGQLIKVISEIHRVLKPEGEYILTTPPKWTNELLKVLSLIKLVSKEEIEEHKKIYSPKEIRNILIQKGFNQTQIQTGYFELRMNIWAKAKK